MAFQFNESGQVKKMTSEELAAEETAGSYILMLDRGTTGDGLPYWSYIKIKPSKYEAFMNAAESGTSKVLSDYGTVIKEGFDAEVPDTVKEEMRREHNFDEDFMRKFQEELRAEQKSFFDQQENQRIGDIVAMLKKKQS